MCEWKFDSLYVLDVSDVRMDIQTTVFVKKIVNETGQNEDPLKLLFQAFA
jgi:hypothetical protein